MGLVQGGCLLHLYSISQAAQCRKTNGKRVNEKRTAISATQESIDNALVSLIDVEMSVCRPGGKVRSAEVAALCPADRGRVRGLCSIKESKRLSISRSSRTEYGSMYPGKCEYGSDLTTTRTVALVEILSNSTTTTGRPSREITPKSETLLHCDLRVARSVARPKSGTHEVLLELALANHRAEQGSLRLRSTARRPITTRRSSVRQNERPRVRETRNVSLLGHMWTSLMEKFVLRVSSVEKGWRCAAGCKS